MFGEVYRYPLQSKSSYTETSSRDFKSFQVQKYSTAWKGSGHWRIYRNHKKKIKKSEKFQLSTWPKEKQEFTIMITSFVKKLTGRLNYVYRNTYTVYIGIEF